MEADKEERSGRRTTSVRARKEEDENASEEATEKSPCCTEQPALFEDGRRETSGRLAVSTRDEVCGLRKAERDLTPRSRRSVALAEESNLSSINRSFGESEDSETSEAGNKSSSNELTVRQLRRQRKPVKTRPGSQEGFENSTSMGGRTLKWDYSGIGLADTPTISKQDTVNGKMETD
ncbi:hypothetical protein NDU88_001072 [Pleurodeles waltl]|uniref:Uncharacterized protein n=1 Tax=Pleurodeles waltl TaxID=8319 RepID=A0AAV7MIQ3_PLEWA|nr:hypothetical protein NDU88_001072 [Pleurodeles waltl]